MMFANVGRIYTSESSEIYELRIQTKGNPK